jgi:hypothetical protein
MSVGLLNLFVGVSSATAISADDQVARDTALRWLTLVDTGHYTQAFNEQTPRTKTISMGRDYFVKWMEVQRAPLGRARSRSFLKVVHTHRMQSSPDGDYQQIAFKTSFDRKAIAVEMMVLSRERGHWQVSGYRLY